MLATTLTLLCTNPLPVALVMLGILCVGVAIVGKIPAVQLERLRALALGAFGAVLILAAVGAAGLLAVLAAPGNKPAPVSVPAEVYANQGWQAANVFVSQGQFLKITYRDGVWSQCAGGGGACAYVEADGFNFESADDNVMSEGCRDASLIARIAHSAPLCVGGHFYAPMEQTGGLELRINDAMLDDNDGSLLVVIEVETK